MHKDRVIFLYLFSFHFLLQLFCISLVPLIFRYSAQILLKMPYSAGAECSPQKSLVVLEILPAEFIEA